jgi:hypothetical protein
MTNNVKLKAVQFRQLYLEHPDFNILEFNFQDKNAGRKLKSYRNGPALETLKTYQRLMRLYPNERFAKVLSDDGIISANHLAAMREDEFIDRFKKKLKLSDDQLKEIYSNAVDVKARTMFLWGNAAANEAPLSRALAGRAIGAEGTTYFQNLPGYQDMFGSLDYCGCKDCKSVLGPAAYFVDLMRITDRYITQPDKGTIPQNLNLKDRRPDLFRLPLTCENTNDLTPYLQIVNEVLGEQVIKALKTQDPEYAVGLASYPFNLPVNLPQKKISNYLQELKTSFSAVYQALKINAEGWAKATLGVSQEWFNLVTTVIADEAKLKKYYGMDNAGDSWKTELSVQKKFLFQTGIGYNQMMQLLNADLSKEEIAAKFQHLFFINKSLPNNGFVSRSVNEEDPSASILNNLANISVLDDVNRFVRLAGQLVWTFPQLYCALRSLGANVITAEVFSGLVAIKSLSEKESLTLESLFACVADMNTFGRGDGPVPLDLFDQVYNNPFVAQGQPSYHPEYAENTLYKDVVQDWKVNDQTVVVNFFGANRLAAALKLTNNELTAVGVNIWGDKATVKLNVPNLSLLFRHSLLLKKLGMSVNDYFTLLGLAGLPKDSVFTTSQLTNIFEQAFWLQQAGLTPLQVNFILSGKANEQVHYSFTTESVRSFMRPFWGMAASTLINNTSFGNGTSVSQENSVNTYTYFVEKKLILELTPQFEVFLQQRIPNQIGLVTRMPTEAEITELNTKIAPPDPAAFDDYVKLVLTKTMQAQQTLLAQQAGAFIGTSPQMAAVILDWATTAQNVNSLKLLYTPLVDNASAVWEDITAYFQFAARYNMLVTLLRMDPLSITGIVSKPLAYNIADLSKPSFDNIRSIYELQRFVKYYNKAEQIAAYFAMPADKACSGGEKAALLAQITQWPQAQICSLVTYFGGSSTYYDDLAGVISLKAVFNIALNTGTDVTVITGLSDLNGLPVDGSTKVGTATVTNWSVWKSSEERMLQSIKSQYTDVAWAAASREISCNVLPITRDAFLKLVTWYLHQTYVDIAYAQNISEYLLMDVETSGCSDVSYVKQGLLALQMYLQRCRMGIEIGASTKLIPDIWWEWMMNYRLWEANRKVFLYPENYIDPGLRLNQSATYKDFKDSLLQSDITSENVRRSYVKYFTAFSDLANLVDAGNYRCTMADEDTPEPTDTIFFFGRTNTKPYLYYYRKCIDPTAENPTWTYWRKIDAKVTSDYISPLFAFNKLFIFWVEMQTIDRSEVKENNTVNNTLFQSRLYYSYYNFSKEWIHEQSLNDNYTIFSWPDPYISTLTDWINALGIDFSKEKLYWKKAYPMALRDTNNKDCILITYGDVFDLPVGTPTNPPEPTGANSAEQAEFNQNLYDAIVRGNNAATAGMTGYNVLTPGVMIKQDLELDETSVILQNTLVNTPFPYRAEIDMANAKLRMIESQNVIVDNYYGDMGNNFGRHGTVEVNLLDKITVKNSNVTTLKNQVGSFVFRNGPEAFLSLSQQKVKPISEILKVNIDLAGVNETDLLTLSYTDEPKPLQDIKFRFLRVSDASIQSLSNRLFIGGIDALLEISAQSPHSTPLLPFSRFEPTSNVIQPIVSDGAQVDFNGSFGPYYKEVFFHIPFLIAKNLTANRQFAEAQKWYEYIFNPTKPVSEGLPPDVPEQNKYWYFYPFRIQKSIADMQANLTNEAQIREYNNHPFDPHAIANLRIGAYEKSIVMSYVENVLDWADDLFSRDTWESITQATTLYFLAFDLLGSKPVKVSECASEDEVVTFQKIQDTYAGKEIPQFLIELESALPVNSTGIKLTSTPINDIDAVFCVPENDHLLKLWDKIEGQLYKIRNCMNIDGQVRQLALFEPPIDVFALVNAFATSGGKSPLKLLQQLRGNGSQYRFAYQIAKAKQTVGTVMDFGSKLLIVLEKGDAEALALLQSANQLVLLNMLTINKQNQILVAQDTLESLKVSLKTATERYNKYTSWIQVGLIPNESANLTALDVAFGFNIAATIAKTASAILYSIPQVGSPFAMTYGGIQLGNVSDAIGAVADLGATAANYVATTNQIKGGYKRREQEWELQANLALGEADQITQQIAAQQVQLQIAQQELNIHEQQIDQEQEVKDFYSDKFTNESLYQWMAARLSTLYYQVYQLALETAIGAQQAFQYELNVKDDYLNFGYWDSLKKGLLAGEGLMLALDQMDKAYSDRNNRRLEIQKTVSLMELAPYELINLKTKGSCNFSFVEKLFDEDYPGQYCRRIKSISITIPAVVGPYQNIKATLTQKSNKIVLEPSIKTVKYLLTGEDAPEAGVLITNWRPNQCIALSGGVNDTGVFELNFQDERYLPFEGTGAISDWELLMPIAANRINYESISDVIIKINYTALDGGRDFYSQVTSLAALQKVNNSVYFNCEQNFSSQWFQLLNTPPVNQHQTLMFSPGKSLIVPHIDNMVVDLLYLQLDVPQNTDLSTASPFLSLNIGSKKQEITLTKNYACVRLDPAIAEADYLAVWEISVDVQKAPASILKNGQLNPEVLLNVELIVSCAGQVNWNIEAPKVFPCKI